MNIRDHIESLSKIDLLRWEKLLEIKNKRVDFALDHHLTNKGEKLNFADFPHIIDWYNSLSPHIVIMGATQVFKCSRNSAKVHTPSGWKLMGELKLGDEVSTPNGKNAKIIGIQPQGKVPIFKVIFKDGRETEVGKEHLWKVKYSKRTFVESRGLSYGRPSETYEILTTEQIAQRLAIRGGRFSIPLSNPVEKPKQKLLIDPYLLGALLGDGTLGTSLCFTNIDLELINLVKEKLQFYGLDLGQDSSKDSNYFFKHSTNHLNINSSNCKIEDFKDLLRQLNLFSKTSYHKFIPKVYLDSTIEDRFAILQGILDTDGRAGDNGSITINTSSKQMAKDIVELVRSLGGIAISTITDTWYIKNNEKIPGATAWRIVISHPTPKELFKLNRKRNNLSDIHRRINTLGPVIEHISRQPDDEATCIVLDDEEHLYITDDYIVTHNSELLLIDTLACADAGLSVFFVLPKHESKLAYVQGRVNKCVQSVDLYRKKIDLGFADNTLLKGFGNGIIKYVGSNTLSDFKEFPGDVFSTEELDECDPNNIIYGFDRLGASRYQFTRFVGNPQIFNKGIHDKFQKSDQRVRVIHCKKCDAWVELDWFSTIVQAQLDSEANVADYILRDTEWKPGCGRDIYCLCPHCYEKNIISPLNRYDLEGKWHPKNPDSRIEGYHISRISGSANTISQLYTDFQEGLVNPNILQQFYNSALGLPFESLGSRLSDDLLFKSSEIEPYFFQIEGSTGYCEEYETNDITMGVDVGGMFDVRISSIDVKNRRKAIYIGKVKHLDSLYKLIEQFNVKVVVMDSGPEARIAHEFQEECFMKGVDCWLCRYSTEGEDRKLRKDNINKVIHADRTSAMDEALNHFRRGKNLIPSNFRNICGGEYVKELIGPVRKLIVDGKQRQRFIWDKCKDHSRHADVYDMLAAHLLQGYVLTEAY